MECFPLLTRGMCEKELGAKELMMAAFEDRS